MRRSRNGFRPDPDPRGYRRDQPQPAPRMARSCDGERSGTIRLPAVDLPPRRLDVAVHRRPAVARLGSQRTNPGADGGDRDHVPPCRQGGNRQRHRSGTWADPEVARACPASVGLPATHAPPTATDSSTRCSTRTARCAGLGTRSNAASLPAAPGRRRPLRLRGRGSAGRQQQARDLACGARPRTWASGIRTDLGLVSDRGIQGLKSWDGAFRRAVGPSQVNGGPETCGNRCLQQCWRDDQTSARSPKGPRSPPTSGSGG
jgi:hypothetical protein